MAEYDGEIISSFDNGNLDEVNKVFNKEIPVTFGTYNDCLMMKSGSESIILYGLYDEIGFNK